MADTQAAEPAGTHKLVQGKRQADRERYARVNGAWPKPLPPMTFDEGRLAAKKLWKIASRKPWPKTRDGKGRIQDIPIEQVSGNRWTNFRNGSFYINPNTGWNDLVHTISHRVHWYAPGNRGESHGTAHASLEYNLIQEVIRRGWLDGKLKREPKAAPTKDVKVIRYEAAKTKLKRWQSKAKRAATAIRKLKETVKYYEKVFQQ